MRRYFTQSTQKYSLHNIQAFQLSRSQNEKRRKMSIALYVLVCTATLAVLAGAQNPRYCNLPICRGKTNTGCSLPVGKTSSNCGKLIHVGVTPAQEKEILNVHNSLRAQVASGKESRGSPGPQPGSKNIHPLKWSNELAELAQTLANQCKYGHDACRSTPEYYVGQNIAESSVYGQDSKSLTSMIESWYNEVEYVNRNLVAAYIPRGGPAIGHYTQMVWGKTTHVGCGVVVYNNDGPWITTYLVCNYGPGGNVYGQPIY